MGAVLVLQTELFYRAIGGVFVLLGLLAIPLFASTRLDISEGCVSVRRMRRRYVFRGGTSVSTSSFPTGLTSTGTALTLQDREHRITIPMTLFVKADQRRIVNQVREALS
jgi:hypothetical protein